MSSASAAGTAPGSGRAARANCSISRRVIDGREQGVAGGGDAHRVEQPVGRRVLEQEPAGADAQRLVDVLVEVEGREHQHRGLELRVGEDPLGRLQAVELRHADVHQDDVGPPAAHDVHAPRGRRPPRPRP